MYQPISKKINFIILTSLIIGVGIVVLILFNSLYQTINRDTRRSMEQQSEILHTSIKNFMITGQAPLAVKLLDDLAESNPYFEIELYRSNGVKAFSDNKTIDIVNNNIGSDFFQRYDAKDSGINNYNYQSNYLPTQTEFMNYKEGNSSLVKIYKPLLNSQNCISCHGSDHEIRGVIEIIGDISDSERQKISGIRLSLIVFPVIVTLLLIIISTFISKSIINPVKQIGEICSQVTNGNFNQKVNIKNKDEIGDLGKTVNTMTTGLRERFELSKYVSNTTLESLAVGNSEGTHCELTLFFSDIRGFTSYSEKHTPKEIVHSLNKILNFQSQIIKSEGGDIDKYVGDEIMAIFTGENQEERACNAAIKIQRELYKNSIKDYDDLKVGIGINKGDVILGMLGSEERADFTVIGDNVNTAARLCSAAGSHEIIISKNVYNSLKDGSLFSDSTTLKVKGKDNNLEVFRYIVR